MASHINNQFFNKGLLLPIVSFVAVMVFAISVQTISVHAIEDIPQVKCKYNGQEYLMNPHLIDEEQNISRVDFPELPDNYEPVMTIEGGETVSMEFDGDKPAELQAFLVDYDADVTETYPLNKINENTFEVTKTGIKTLEAVATFDDDTQVSYTLLVDVEEA